MVCQRHCGIKSCRHGREDEARKAALNLLICSVFVENGSPSFNVGDYVVISRYTGL